MSYGQGGLDPRITGPASLAQVGAGKQQGLPLISDDEAERRQRAADAARGRRRRVMRAVVAGAAVLIGAGIGLVLLTPGS